MISGFVANPSNYPSKPCPPTIKQCLKSVNLVKVLSTLTVYKASSLVGNIRSALAPTVLLCSFNLLTIGIIKAAVLPEPVLAQATTSLPYNKWGIAFLYIGVGTLNPLDFTALYTG